MKKIIFFCLCPFLSYQLFAQPFEKKQITNFNYDSRGTAFPTYFGGVYPWYVSSIFFEAHEGNSANIMMMSYNSSSDSFYNQMPITLNNYKNIHPVVDDVYDTFSGDHKINLMWQTSENGNWDIALKSLIDTTWSTKKFIVNSPADETNPKFVLQDYWLSPRNYEIEVIYEKDNSIFLYQQQDSLINHEEVFKGNDTLIYSQPTGINFYSWQIPSGLYITTTCKTNDNRSKIVYRYKSFSDSLWSQIYTAYDSGYCENPQFFCAYYRNPFLSFETVLDGIRQITIIPDMIYLGQNQYATNLIDNPTQSTFDLISIHYGPFAKRGQFNIYGPYSYKVISNDSVFIVYTPQNFLYNQIFYTKVPDTKLGVGNLGMTSSDYAVSYIVWEDSANGHINLFGVKRLDVIGDVNDKIVGNNFILYQNYPNPFNPKTIIKYNMLSRDFVTIKVFDVLGNEISILVNEEKSAGEYSQVFDGSNLASGIYVYRLSAGNHHLSRKMILLK